MSSLISNRTYTDKIVERLTDINFNISTLLNEHNAIIAGGFLLSVLNDHKSSDVDIYVNRQNAYLFIKNIYNMMREQYSAVEYEINISKPTSASPYDQSFFYKNKILSKFTFRINRKHFFNMEFIPFIFNFDIMIVDDEMPVGNVAKNFDLSFCELWYDGINLHSNSNIDDILAKKGILKPDYVNSLLQYRNKFIHDRIMKYMKRGYIIG